MLQHTPKSVRAPVITPPVPSGLSGQVASGVWNQVAGGGLSPRGEAASHSNLLLVSARSLPLRD